MNLKCDNIYSAKVEIVIIDEFCNYFQFLDNHGTKKLRTPIFSTLQISIKRAFWVQIPSLIMRSASISCQILDIFSSEFLQEKLSVSVIAASKSPINF